MVYPCNKFLYIQNNWMRLGYEVSDLWRKPRNNNLRNLKLRGAYIFLDLWIYHASCYAWKYWIRNRTCPRGPQREEMVYEIPNLYGFTQDSAIRWILISYDFLIILYNVTNMRNKTEIFEYRFKRFSVIQSHSVRSLSVTLCNGLTAVTRRLSMCWWCRFCWIDGFRGMPTYSFGQ